MANFSDHIRIFVDTVSDVTGFRTFRTEVQAADGVLGKLKAGSSAVWSAISENAGLAAAVIGGALIKAGISAIDKFDAMAIAARNLASATGLTVEQASRWIGASKDMGVNQDLLFHGMSQIAKHINDDVWAKYGIQVHDAAGQLRPVNDILLDAAGLFDSMGNATQRAAAGEALFRRGYRTLSPLFAQGKEALKGYLATVEDSQVITGHELAQAEQNIRAQKDLKQAFGALSLELGHLLVSATPIIKVLTDVVNPVVKLGTAALGTVTGVHQATDGFQDFFGAIGQSGTATKSMQDITDQLWNMAKAGGKAQSFFTNFKDNISNFGPALTGDVNYSAENFRNLKSSLNDLAKDSPESAAAVVQSLKAVVAAAQNGDKYAKDAVSAYALNGRKIADLSAQYTSLSDAQQETGLETRRLTDNTLDYADAQQQAEDDAKALEQQIAANQKAQAELNAIVEEARKKLDDYRKSVDDIRKSQLDAVSSTGDYEQSVRDVQSAYIDLQKKIQDNIETQKDSKASDLDKQQALIDVANAQKDVTDRIYESAKAYAASRGDQEGSTTAINDTINALIIAKQQYPELGDQIDAYITKLKNIPPTVDTNVMLHLNAHLDNIIIDGETHAAGSTTLNVGSRVAVNRSAKGGPVSGLTTLSEEGHELVFLPHGSAVLGASQTANREASMGTSHATYYSTIVMPPGLSPEGVASAARIFERRGGRK